MYGVWFMMYDVWVLPCNYDHWMDLNNQGLFQYGGGVLDFFICLREFEFIIAFFIVMLLNDCLKILLLRTHCT